MSKYVFIRALSIARYSSSLCYRLNPGSSAQAALGFCCMQMTYDMTLSSPWKSGKNPWSLSDRCRKKCRLLWWMLVLDPQEMHWNQRLLAP